MRLVLAAVMIMAATALVAKPVEAGGYKKSRSHKHSNSNWKSKRDRYRDRQRETFDTIVANDLDPGRTYGGYPDWARIALSPKSGGRN